MSIQKWPIGKKLWFLSGLLLCNLLIQAGLGFYFAERFIGLSEDLASRELPAVRYMTLADMMQDGLMGVAYRAIVSSEDSDQKGRDDVQKESEEMAKNFHEYLGELQALKLGPSVETPLQEVLPIIDTYVGQMKKIVNLSLSNQRKDADIILVEFQKTFAVLEDKLGKLGDVIEGNAKKVQEDAVRLKGISEKIQGVVIVLGLILGIFNAFWIIRGLMKTVNDVTNNLESQVGSVNSTVSTMNLSAQNLSSASVEQAASLQETASSIEEMSAMVKKSSENAQKAREVAESSQEVAQKGKLAVEEMLNSMGDISVSNQNIMQQVEQSNQQISEIVKVINEIGNKTKVINDIVFQTKLLSFNASVEAARAGEHGKGFAVVAEEVGNLAQMSGNAAKEISDMLTGSIQKVERIVTDTKTNVERLVAEGKSKVDSGSLVAKQCAEVLDEMVKNVQDVNGMIGEISTASQEQAQGVSEITKAMNQLDQATHANAGTAQESAASAGEMATQAEKLLEIVSILKNLVHGEGEGVASRLQTATLNLDSAALPSVKTAQFEALPRNLPSDEATWTEPVKRSKVVGGDELPSEDDLRFIDL